MEQNFGIKEMLKLAISMEDDGVQYYMAMAEKSGEYHLSAAYMPKMDEVKWSEDKGFYVKLAKSVLGEGYTNFYQMPEKITRQDSVNFYQGLGKRVSEDVKSVLLGLVADEKRHGQLFRKWLERVDEETESKAFSPEAGDFFDTYSKNMTFDTQDNEPATIYEALKRAIATEDGAVEFYSGMLKYASPEVAKMLEKIVHEEQGHKTKLEEQKAKFDALMH